ncbi:MAG: hypothetical protein HC795_01500 [Coleofasciculaceae cyanobacterium RL_1_1]|nr:hypothetical protein [Coleofasciculaceae cyanobacterium RL_1_1]
MNSQDLARYIEQTDGVSKPWLLAQLRLSKLKERRDTLSPAEYIQALDDIQADLMQLGEWWIGREAEVFGLGQNRSDRSDLNDRDRDA